MIIAMGCDHRGVALKSQIIEFLKERGHQVLNAGTDADDPVDYPDYAAVVCRLLRTGRAERGILICASGVGMCIAANKFPGIRAALCLTEDIVKRARTHNDANVLCLAADFLDTMAALRIVSSFLSTSFEGGRHQRRLDKIAGIEKSLLDNK